MDHGGIAPHRAHHTPLAEAFHHARKGRWLALRVHTHHGHRAARHLDGDLVQDIEYPGNELGPGFATRNRARSPPFAVRSTDVSRTLKPVPACAAAPAAGAELSTFCSTTKWDNPNARSVWVAGFSFGAFATCQAVNRLWPQRALESIVLVGTAASRFEVAPLPPEAHERTLVVHGEQDDTVPLAAVMDWARPQWLPVTVIPGVEHFFHGQLTLLKHLVVRHLNA